MLQLKIFCSVMINNIIITVRYSLIVGVGIRKSSFVMVTSYLSFYDTEVSLKITGRLLCNSLITRVGILKSSFFLSW